MHLNPVDILWILTILCRTSKTFGKFYENQMEFQAKKIMKMQLGAENRIQEEEDAARLR